MLACHHSTRTQRTSCHIATSSSIWWWFDRPWSINQEDGRQYKHTPTLRSEKEQPSCTKCSLMCKNWSLIFEWFEGNEPWLPRNATKEPGKARLRSELFRGREIDGIGDQLWLPNGPDWLQDKRPSLNMSWLEATLLLPMICVRSPLKVSAVCTWLDNSPIRFNEDD